MFVLEKSYDELDIASAAQRLGVSLDTMRKRVQRGMIQAHKRDGRWFVVLEEPKSVPDNQSSTDTGPVQEPVQDEAGHFVAEVTEAYKQLASSRQSEIDFLRQELQARTEELRRKDHIIATLTQRIPELPATVDRQEQLQQKSWLQRIFGK